MINKNTKLFISASGSPGDFGATVYNRLFKKFGINAVYLPRKITDETKLIESIKTLDIRGCSVTMPLKSRVVGYLDKIDEIVEKTGSVNTIVNKNSILYGYNTDYFGALEIFLLLKPQSALIYGAGSVTSSVILALRDSGCEDINIVARNPDKALEISKKFSIKYIDKVENVNKHFGVLINTTPASIEKEHEMHSLLIYVDTVFDVVVSPTKTELITIAQNMGCKTIEGIEMSKAQLKKQFEIYTGIECETEAIDEIVKSFYKT